MDDSLAVQTRVAQALFAFETTAYWRARRDGATAINMAGLQAAERDYEHALHLELEAVKRSHASLKPKPVAKEALARGKLWVRGTARLTAGIVVGIAWGAAGGCLLPHVVRSKTGNFALGVCCEGGVSDIKRAGALPAAALAAKREYQLHMELHRAHVVGYYGPRIPGEPTASLTPSPAS